MTNTYRPSPQPRTARPLHKPAWRRLPVVLGTLASGAVILVGATTILLPDDASRPERDNAVAGIDTTTAVPAPSAITDITWNEVAGVSLPFSRTHGPRLTRDSTAGGYSRSTTGAALAAVQVLVRTSAAAGPRIYAPVLATQVTGADLPAMRLAVNDEYQRLRAQAGVADGEPVPTGGGAQVLGYVVRGIDLHEGTATLDVVLTSPDLSPSARSVAFRVEMRWQNDDWRIVAPANGDWGTTAMTLGAVPDGLVGYGG
ncbi:MAG: hypothetical protein HY830_22865 [Actinobacteria bacterium]|nr:hypothetical protein [Actinomycetota bacterium]